MSLKMKWFTLLVFTALLAACAPAAATQTPPAPDSVVADTPTPEPPTPAPALTVEMLKNAEYSVALFDETPLTFRLANGMFQNGTDPAVMGYLAANMAENIAFGDLDGDGDEDAAVIIGFNTGGTGVFMFLYAVRNDGGQPVEAGSFIIDDRAMINGLAIENGIITLDAVVHGFEDPGCCPGFQVKRTYRLAAEPPVLTLTSQASKTANGLDRIITIETPADGADSASPVLITGNVTIAPFENNLAYRIYDPLTGAELKAGPLMVNAPDLGAPGTFDAEIMLDIAPSGPYIRIELQELSMADGSLLTMDSVTLRVP